MRFVPAIVAAGLVAVDDLLVGHAWQMYSEIPYIPLLLCALPGAAAGSGHSAAGTLCLGWSEHGGGHAVPSATALLPLAVP